MTGLESGKSPGRDGEHCKDLQMAISIADIPLFVDIEVARLEKKIDADLLREFSSEAPTGTVEAVLWPTGVPAITDHHQCVADRLASRYRAAGWEVHCVAGNDGRAGPVTFFPALIIIEKGEQTRESTSCSSVAQAGR